MGRPKGSKNKGPSKNLGAQRADWKKRFGTDFKDAFYTYTWYRQKYFTPYYVGKGTGIRAFISNGHGVHRPVSLACIVIQTWESKEKALDMEKWWIKFWGRKDNGTGILRNLTDGGEDPPINSPKGFKHSEESKRVLSEKGKKAWKDPEYAKYMSEVHRGKPPGNLGKPHSEESKKKMSVAHKLTPKKTHCRKGHEYTPDNTYIEPRTGSRRCIECNKIKYKKYKALKIKIPRKTKFNTEQVQEIFSLLDEGLTQREVASRVGANQQYISRMVLKRKKN